MQREIKYALSMIGFGISLVTYAHFNFATSDRVARIENQLNGVATKSDVNKIVVVVEKIRDEILEIYKNR